MKTAHHIAIAAMAAATLELGGCSSKSTTPIPCVYTVSGAITITGGSCNAAVQNATSGPNSTFEMTQDLAAPGMQGIVVALGFEGVPKVGTFASADMSSTGSILVIDPANDQFSATASVPDSGNSSFGTYTLTLASVESLGLGEYQVHGTLTATLVAIAAPFAVSDAGPLVNSGAMAAFSATF